MLGRIAFTAAVGAVLLPAAVQAQTAPISKTITLTYSGVVTSTASDTLYVVQPDGSKVQWTGPLPDFPYIDGDKVSISFNATVPTKAFYDTAYHGQVAADGIYQFKVSSPYYNGGTSPGGIGNSTAADVSGPITWADNSGQPTNTVMTIVYDYNNDSYSILGAGDFTSGAYGGPGFVWDAATSQFVSCSGPVSCQGSASSSPVIFGLSQQADGSISTGNIAVRSTDPLAATGNGFFSMVFSGSWNLPAFGGGGSTQVPEPGMLVLFSLGAGAVAFRRRRLRLA